MEGALPGPGTGPSRTPGDDTPAEDVLDSEVMAGLDGLDSPDSWEVSELVGTFTETAATRLGQMRRAMEAGDIAEVEALAHSLRGSSLSFGARRMAELCAELEALPSDAMMRATGIVDRLEDAFHAARRALEARFPPR